MERNVNLSDRIRKLIDHYGLNVNELAKRSGGSRMKYYNLLNGTSKPDFETLERILFGFPGISAEWLMRGVGHMLIDEIPTTEEVENLRNENSVLQRMFREEVKKAESKKTRGAINSPGRLKEIKAEDAKKAIRATRRKPNFYLPARVHNAAYRANL